LEEGKKREKKKKMLKKRDVDGDVFIMSEDDDEGCEG